MKHKDYEPIKFEMFQSDMEEIMALLPDGSSAKYKLQCKIDYHILHGDWK